MMILRRDFHKKIRYTLIVLVLVLLASLAWRPIERVFKPVIEFGVFGGSHFFQAIGSVYTGLKLYVQSNQSLYEQNQELIRALEAERMKYIELQMLREELNKYTSISDKMIESQLFTRRIGSIDNLLYKTFRIDAGSQQNVSLGTFVVGPQSVLLGMVEEVSPRTSLVRALWGQDDVLARINATGTVVSVSGAQAGLYQADVPHEVFVQVGDIFTYDADPRFIIGVVEKIYNNEGEPFKQVFVQVPFHPSMIDTVFLTSPL